MTGAVVINEPTFLNFSGQRTAAMAAGNQPLKCPIVLLAPH